METALVIAGGIVGASVGFLVIAEAYRMVDGERPPSVDPDDRPPDFPRPTP